ncbi:hypothetical protein Vadar_006026 [Vaccinium darrowii]|uniref:Uncharacterized protein n=1 Tax=Vaccinium darrowii TaxID=229202 RepID=A0ACB7WYP0_9ERIC|nr:hypothetical protein Vadar_006026 [Vaccinium darrowii]
MGNDRRRSISPATTSPTSFCKIILPSVMHCHRLRVPEEFSKKYGNELSNLVKFTVRSGQVCHVGVEKADKMLWFTDGWKESENHSIGCGFCVVFNYDGNSKFKVLFNLRFLVANSGQSVAFGFEDVELKVSIFRASEDARQINLPE